MKHPWLNLILHLSSLLYRKKNALFSARPAKTVFLMVQILILEIVMAIIALPFYFFIGPDKTKIPRSHTYQIKVYRLRRRLTLAALAVFTLLIVVNIALGVFSFTRYTQQSYASLNAGLTRVGKYEGNGSDNRMITDIGFKPDIVIIKADQSNIPIVRTTSMTGDISKPLTTWTGLTENLIQAFTDNGFTIGNDQRVNDKGKLYYWVAFKQVDGLVRTGAYVGNGEEQAINEIGFTPEYVIVMAENGNLAVHRSMSMDKSYFIESDEGSTNRITNFTEDGFTVGNSSATNSDGVTYYYIVWRYLPGIIEQGSQLFKLFAEPRIRWGQ